MIFKKLITYFHRRRVKRFYASIERAGVYRIDPPLLEHDAPLIDLLGRIGRKPSAEFFRFKWGSD